MEFPVLRISGCRVDFRDSDSWSKVSPNSFNFDVGGEKGLPSLNHSKQPLAVTDDDNNDESLKNRHYCKAMFMLPILIIIMVSTRIS
mmetsp:Transcript_8447/g.12624  ORF Transcript_8447/g.12624 Transcript_8447/m.12624 type:complete len:87 (-) Transcript_8447:502-762(-)